MNTEPVVEPISIEQLLEKKAADAHVALMQFMNRSRIPFLPSAQKEYEELLFAAEKARDDYLKVANALGMAPLQTYCVR
jgi:hypothetical protein